MFSFSRSFSRHHGRPAGLSLAWLGPLSLAFFVACSDDASEPSPAAEVAPSAQEPIEVIPERDQVIAEVTDEPDPTGAEPSSAESAAEPAPPPAPALSGVDWAEALAGSPPDVLVGTDLVPLTEFYGQIQALPKVGAFVSDQGGAESTLKLRVARVGWTMRRVYLEPGERPRKRRYRRIRPHYEGRMGQGPGVRLLGVQGGLLVREVRPRVQGLAGDFWVFYGVQE